MTSAWPLQRILVYTGKLAVNWTSLNFTVKSFVLQALIHNKCVPREEVIFITQAITIHYPAGIDAQVRFFWMYMTFIIICLHLLLNSYLLSAFTPAYTWNHPIWLPTQNENNPVPNDGSDQHFAMGADNKIIIKATAFWTISGVHRILFAF